MKITKISQEDYPKKCQECHGDKFIYQKTKNLGTLEYNEHLMACPSCNGKGYVTKEDHEAYMHSMGVGSCPHKETI